LLQTDWQTRDQISGVSGEGIQANRWAVSTDDALAVLGYPELDYVDVLNSWGRNYPHMVRMPATTLEVLRKQNGEIGIVVDR
jgi:hypothetical protein